MGLMEDNSNAVHDFPDSMSEIVGIAGDGVIEGVTGKESDVLQDAGKWIGGQPADTLDLLLPPAELGAPTLAIPEDNSHFDFDFDMENLDVGE